MNLSRYEQETTINFNEEEKPASVYTHNVALGRKLDRLVQERAADCRLLRRGHDGRSVEYIVPKCWIKVTPTRQIGEAQREALQKARGALKTSARPETLRANSPAEGNDTTGT